MEQSASLSASTSFTPSPVMATVCPCFLSARTSRRFIVRRHAAEYDAFARRLFDLLVGLERARVHCPVRVRDPRAAGDLGNRERVVAGDHACTATPSRANHANVPGASARILLESSMSEMGSRSAVSASSVSCPS